MKAKGFAITATFWALFAVCFSFGCAESALDLSSVPKKDVHFGTPTSISKTGSKLIHEIPGRTRGIVRGESVNQGGVRWNKMTPPKVWLEFDVEQEGANESVEIVKVELPEDAKVIIDDFWRFWNKRYDLKSNILELNHTTYNLHQVEIETPAGKRPISLDEAKDLVDFMVEAEKLIKHPE